MWTDRTLTFARGETVRGSDKILGDVIDLGAPYVPKSGTSVAAGPLFAVGKPMALVLQTRVAMAGGTSITFSLRSSAAAALSSPRTHMSVTGTTAQLTVGASIIAYLPYITWLPYLRYIGVHADVAGTATAGTWDAFLTLDPPHWEATYGEPVRLT